MIPFENTMTYDRVGSDIFASSCPFCDKSHVLLPLKPKELEALGEGVKKLLVFPCCHNRVTLVDADRDYLLANKPLRRSHKS
ncbi:hypothetical protein [Paenibacillus sp. YYML68]|uniref:hypothetical protein n=1 Tax=Paenibacillus sp. YYML68 TaxID=2909250 RepID=UPI0024908B19|nr:hypothetical protein [Paenibacillus sp. YYML68]